MKPGRFDESSSWFNLGRLWRSTTFWILLSFSLAWYICYRYCAVASARDPTSYFFDEKKGYQRSYSIEREKQAYTYIESANHTDSPSPSPSVNPSMCIGVATVARRSEEQYVRGTIGSLLEGLSDAERAEIHFIVFIAHTDPSVHPIYHEPWLKAVSNKVLTYDVSKTDLAQLRMFEEDHHPRNKSMYDYGYLLRNCLKTGAQWITVVEDDVIARAGWYTMAASSLRRVQEQVGDANWLYLRMFYTEALLGWNSEEWPRYLGWSFFLFMILLSALIGSRTRSPLLRRQISNAHVAVLCCCCLPAFISLYFMAGRMTMQPPPAGVRPMSRFGCCSQGFIFPRKIVPHAIERIKKAMYEDYYIDMLFERYADTEHLARFAHFPSLLQHVGVRSSKGWGFDEFAGMTWNFEFETFSP